MYWRFQFWIDLLAVILITLVVTSGWVPLLRVAPDASQIVSACRLWVAPILTLLGLVCATTAFLFTALDRSEFHLLRKIGVEDQLWSIFSEIIFWLAVAAIAAAAISFVDSGNFPAWLRGFAFFLFLMVALCLIKFTWVMRHIISVRVRQ